MSVRLLVDMNLSVEWVAELAGHGWSAVHWSSVGDPQADDATIMAWALTNGYVVFTHDLDFGTTLALTQAAVPAYFRFAVRKCCQRISAALSRPRCANTNRRLRRASWSSWS